MGEERNGLSRRELFGAGAAGLVAAALPGEAEALAKPTNLVQTSYDPVGRSQRQQVKVVKRR